RHAAAVSLYHALRASRIALLAFARLAKVPSSEAGRVASCVALSARRMLAVAAASSTVKDTGHIPIQELFNSRNGAMLLMAMAVLIAPLIEETVFRGYLYPLFANKFARLANRLGAEPALAVRRGMIASI